MGRKPLLPEDKKELFTIRLPLWMILRLKKFDNYNRLVETLLLEYLKKKD